MALRRPRLKASANLLPKRKVKKENEEVSKEEAPKCPETTIMTKKETLFSPDIKTVTITPGSPERKPLITDKIESQEKAPVVQDDYDFKCPQIKEKPEISAMVNFTSQDVESNLGASPNHYSRLSSPVKPRQRIRPMPYFARRNSIQGGNAESEDELKRHKINSTVVHSPLPADTKIHPLSTNRKRTESSCSNVSESNFLRETRVRRVFATEESQRISVAKKEFQSKFSGKTPEKSLLKMFDFIYYNPVSNPMKQRAKPENEAGKEAGSTEEIPPDHNPVKKPPEITETNNTPPEQENTESSMPVPQLKLGPNGELVLDEKSLVIETAAEKDARANLANSSVIYVDENTENNGFYKRQKRTKDWTSDETIKFYRCLHTVGTDFSLMLTLFPNRSRRDLKLKFKKEEKTNLNLVNKALLYPKMFDIEELKRDLEKDERDAAEKQKKWEEIKKKNTPQKLKDTIKVKSNPKTRNRHKSKASRCMRSGDIAYENENMVKRGRRKCEKGGDEPVIEQEDAIQDDEEYTLDEQTLFDTLIDTDNSTVASFQSNTIVKKDCEIIDVIDENVQEGDEVVDGFSDSHNDEVLENPEMANQFLSNVNCVLREIANGSLVVVSSEDPNNPQKTINEIYVICKETGELSDEPLDLPDDVMQCIFSAIQT